MSAACCGQPRQEKRVIRFSSEASRAEGSGRRADMGLSKKMRRRPYPGAADARGSKVGLEGNAEVASRLRIEVDAGQAGIGLADVGPIPILLVEDVVDCDNHTRIGGRPEPGGQVVHAVA